MTRIKTGKLAALGLALMLMSAVTRADVSATADRTTITEVDLVTLTLRTTDEHADIDPVFTGIDRDFEIVNAMTTQSSSTTIVNGRRTRVVSRDHILTLRAKRLGRLTIPSILVGTRRTAPIQIHAQQQSSSARQQMTRLVFFETEVDTNETYVQAQIIYSVRLFYTEAIGGDFPQPPVIEDAVVETIETEKRYESIVDGRRFYVLEKRYAIFPQRSGKLQIRRETFTGTRGRGGFFSERQRVHAVSKSHTITVKTIPPGFTGDAWIPAKALAISESWADSPPTFRVGEPINRKLTISAVGLSESLLPPLGDLPVPDAKIYADPPVTDKRVGTDGITALQATTFGVVPTKEGELNLPEIRIPWWNTRTDREEIAIVPAATYTVLPAASVSAYAPRVTVPISESNATEMLQAPGSLMWQYIAIALGLMWLVSTWQWFTLRRQVARLKSAETVRYVPQFEDPDEKRLFSDFVNACKRNQAAAAHRQLFLWAKAKYPALQSLTDLVRADPKGPLAAEIAQLEAALYGSSKNDNWTGRQLAKTIKELRQQKTDNKKLPALAPTLNPA